MILEFVILPFTIGKLFSGKQGIHHPAESAPFKFADFDHMGTIHVFYHQSSTIMQSNRQDHMGRVCFPNRMIRKF
jgi:hypothetical protein